jgi:hypothetical protein
MTKAKVIIIQLKQIPNPIIDVRTSIQVGNVFEVDEDMDDSGLYFPSLSLDPVTTLRTKNALVLHSIFWGSQIE